MRLSLNAPIICKIFHGKDIPAIILNTTVLEHCEDCGLLKLKCSDKEMYRQLLKMFEIRNMDKEVNRYHYKIKGLRKIEDFSIVWNKYCGIVFKMSGASIVDASECHEPLKPVSNLSNLKPINIIVTRNPGLLLKESVIQEIRDATLKGRSR